MRRRQLGNTELELTAVGLGSWAIGGSWEWGWGGQDDSDSIAAIAEAMDRGINWIDTAPVYGCGHAEEVVGRAIREMGVKPIVASKCGLLWDDQRRKMNCLRAGSIIAECETSLKRLGIEAIDLYQIHWPEPEEMIEEAWSAMAELVKQGKVRYIGVSNFDAGQLERLMGIHPVAALQPPYSMIKRRAEDELLGYCGDNDIGVVVYSPMQKGLLTGKFSAERVAALAADDHRRRDPDFLEPKLGINLELVEGLRPIAERNGKTLAQLAVAWVLRRDEVTAAIVGARKAGQIAETAEGGDWVLADDDIAEVEELLTIREHALCEVK